MASTALGIGRLDQCQESCHHGQCHQLDWEELVKAFEGQCYENLPVFVTQRRAFALVRWFAGDSNTDLERNQCSLNEARCPR